MPDWLDAVLRGLDSPRGFVETLQADIDRLKDAYQAHLERELNKVKSEKALLIDQTRYRDMMEGRNSSLDRGFSRTLDSRDPLEHMDSNRMIA